MKRSSLKTSLKGVFRDSAGATACLGCKICDPAAITTGSCTGGSVSDVTCTCGEGFYGTGLTCNACKICDTHATKSGQQCSSGSLNDTLFCTCNVGYYGTGIQCTLCTSGGSNVCACNAGYYGFGTSCSPCITCDQHATMAGSCPAGSGSDQVQCTCNVGYYGIGTQCTPCQICDRNSTTPGTCPPGTLNYYTCSCKAGFFGNGETCTPCATGTYTSNPGPYMYLSCKTLNTPSDFNLNSIGDVKQTNSGSPSGMAPE